VCYSTHTQLIGCLVVMALEMIFFTVLTWDGMQQDLLGMSLFGVGAISGMKTATRSTTTVTAAKTDATKGHVGVVTESAKITDTTSLYASVEKTIEILISMGVHPDELTDQSVIPPWSQIVQNFGTTDEPIILGLEQCQAYRDATPAKDRFVGVAGMFSTGTNVFQNLMAENCLSPDMERRVNPRRFNLKRAPVSVP
jgi:hypothetical protein